MPPGNPRASICSSGFLSLPALGTTPSVEPESYLEARVGQLRVAEKLSGDVADVGGEELSVQVGSKL